MKNKDDFDRGLAFFIGAFDRELTLYAHTLQLERKDQKEKDAKLENARIRKQARIDVAFLTEMEQKIEQNDILYLKEMIKDWKEELRRKFKRVPKAVQEKK